MTRRGLPVTAPVMTAEARAEYERRLAQRFEVGDRVREYSGKTGVVVGVLHEAPDANLLPKWVMWLLYLGRPAPQKQWHYQIKFDGETQTRFLVQSLAAGGVPVRLTLLFSTLASMGWLLWTWNDATIAQWVVICAQVHCADVMRVQTVADHASAICFAVARVVLTVIVVRLVEAENRKS